MCYDNYWLKNTDINSQINSYLRRFIGKKIGDQKTFYKTVKVSVLTFLTSDNKKMTDFIKKNQNLKIEFNIIKAHDVVIDIKLK